MRFDSARLARFTSPDPFGGSISAANPQSWNRYEYVANDPLNLTDPSGLASCDLKCQERLEHHNNDDIAFLGNFAECGRLDGVPVPCIIANSFFGSLFAAGAVCLGDMCSQAGPNDTPPVPAGQVWVPASSVSVDDGLGNTSTGYENGYFITFAQFQQILGELPDAANNGTPQQPTWKQKNQDCLNKFNEAPESKYFYNFLSPLSMIPGIGPEWKSSIAEDVGGSAAKYGVFKFFQAASTNWAGTGLGSMGGLVADTMHLGASFVTKTLVPAAVVGQLTGHAGCSISAAF